MTYLGASMLKVCFLLFCSRLRKASSMGGPSTRTQPCPSPVPQNRPLAAAGPALLRGNRSGGRGTSRASAASAASPASRSVSASPRSNASSRTDSPSPQHHRRQPPTSEGRRQPVAPRPTSTPPPKTRTHEPASHRNRPLPSAATPGRGKREGREGKPTGR